MGHLARWSFYGSNTSGDIVWEHEDPYHHHDAQWLHNGHLLYTVASPIPVKKGRGLFNPKVPLEMQQRPFSDIVREVNRKGEVVGVECHRTSISG